MTKTFRFIGMVLMAVLVSVSFAACGGNDDGVEDAIENNLSNDAKNFVGFWSMSGNNNASHLDYVCFFPNGECTAGGDYNWGIRGGSSWTYDSSTGI